MKSILSVTLSFSFVFGPIVPAYSLGGGSSAVSPSNRSTNVDFLKELESFIDDYNSELSLPILSLSEIGAQLVDGAQNDWNHPDDVEGYYEEFSERSFEKAKNLVQRVSGIRQPGKGDSSIDVERTTEFIQLMLLYFVKVPESRRAMSPLFKAVDVVLFSDEQRIARQKNNAWLHHFGEGVVATGVLATALFSLPRTRGFISSPLKGLWEKAVQKWRHRPISVNAPVDIGRQLMISPGPAVTTERVRTKGLPNRYSYGSARSANVPHSNFPVAHNRQLVAVPGRKTGDSLKFKASSADRSFRFSEALQTQSLKVFESLTWQNMFAGFGFFAATVGVPSALYATGAQQLYAKGIFKQLNFIPSNELDRKYKALAALQLSCAVERIPSEFAMLDWGSPETATSVSEFLGNIYNEFLFLSVFSPELIGGPVAVPGKVAQDPNTGILDVDGEKIPCVNFAQSALPAEVNLSALRGRLLEVVNLASKKLLANSSNLAMTELLGLMDYLETNGEATVEPVFKPFVAGQAHFDSDLPLTEGWKSFRVGMAAPDIRMKIDEDLRQVWEAMPEGIRADLRDYIERTLNRWSDQSLGELTKDFFGLVIAQERPKWVVLAMAAGMSKYLRENNGTMADQESVDWWWLARSMVSSSNNQQMGQ